MPPRTNTFHQLIFLIKQHLADGSEVTESAMLEDRGTGTPREVDVTIKTVVGGHTVTISLECRAHARKQGVGWVEEMQTKHAHLPTNVLVLVSESGFTTEAERKAALYGIELVRPDDPNPQLVGRIVNRLNRLWIKTFKSTVTRVVVETVATPHHASERLDIPPHFFVFDEDGVGLGPMRELSQVLLRIANFGEQLRDATESHDRFMIGMAPAELKLPDGGVGRFYLHRQDPTPHPVLIRAASSGAGAPRFSAGSIAESITVVA